MQDLQAKKRMYAMLTAILAAYLICAFPRGAITGEYPYPFVDAGALDYGQVAINVLVLMVVFWGVGITAVIGRAIFTSQ